MNELCFVRELTSSSLDSLYNNEKGAGSTNHSFSVTDGILFDSKIIKKDFNDNIMERFLHLLSKGIINGTNTPDWNRNKNETK